MVISNIPVYAIAESASKLGTSTSTETNLTPSKQEFDAASSSKVLDYVDKEELESHKFVGRVLKGYNITATQSNAIAQAFTDFIWEKIEDER